MKLKSKIIISFCIIIFVPIVLMMAALFSFQRIQVKAIEQTYGIKENNYSYFSNSMQLLSRFTKECFKELKDAAKNDPARLEDQEYLNELNQTLEEKSSYLIVRKDKELIYIGEDASISLLTQLPSYGDTVKDEDAGTYIDGDEQVLIKQIDFQFQDGSDGSAFIVTILEETVPEVKKLLIDVLISILLILVLTATMLTIWMYTSMINPIKKLQTAAQNIKDGNLDFSVESDSRDEIGELCRSFEEMRLRLKDNAEEKIEGEKENKTLISNIAHDLKTPITAVKGYAEGLMDGVADTPALSRSKAHLQLIIAIVNVTFRDHNIQCNRQRIDYLVIDLIPQCNQNIIALIKVFGIQKFQNLWIDTALVFTLHTCFLLRFCRHIRG